MYAVSLEGLNENIPGPLCVLIEFILNFHPVETLFVITTVDAEILNKLHGNLLTGSNLELPVAFVVVVIGTLVSCVARRFYGCRWITG